MLYECHVGWCRLYRFFESSDRTNWEWKKSGVQPEIVYEELHEIYKKPIQNISSPMRNHCEKFSRSPSDEQKRWRLCPGGSWHRVATTDKRCQNRSTCHLRWLRAQKMRSVPCFSHRRTHRPANNKTPWRSCCAIQVTHQVLPPSVLVLLPPIRKVFRLRKLTKLYWSTNRGIR